MKIAYFIGALNRGGAESLILDICRQHKQAPFEFVCVYRHNGNLSEAFKASGTLLINIPKSLGFIRYILAIRKVLLQEHITIVHSQTPSNTLLLAFALLGADIKIITTFHGHLFADAAWWKRKIVYAASDKIICVSEYQKRYYEQNWGLPKDNKLRVVYNGIDFTKFNQKSERVRELENEDRIRLCMVGNFIKGRSQYIICEAIDQLKKQGITDFDFCFIGRRDEAESWRYDDCVKYCEENQLINIHFLGSREDVPTILKSLDGFIYSTEHDTFGIAIVEAVAAGLPVVVNDWPVMTEICNLGLPKSNRAIRFFKTDDVDDCAKQMKNLISELQNHGDQLKKDCQQAAEAANQKYSIQKHIDNLYAVYQNI